MSSLFFGSTARFLRQMAAVRAMTSSVRCDGDSMLMMIGKPLSDRTALRISAAGYANKPQLTTISIYRNVSVVSTNIRNV